MAVMGIAEKKPAAETWAMDRVPSGEITGETERTRFLPRS